MDRNILVTDSYRKALALHQAGRLEEASALYLGVLEHSPEHGDAKHLLGVLRFQEGRLEEAERLVREAIALKGGVADFHFNLGAILQARGRHGEAEAALRVAARLKPHDAGILNNLAVALLAQDKAGEAEQVLRRAVGYVPDDAELHFNLGNALRRLGRADVAEASYRKAIALRGDYAAAWVNLGESAYSRGAWEVAESALREALRLSPGHREAANDLGALLRTLGRHGEAETLMRGLLADSPDYAEGWNNLGIILNDEGRLEEAEACFRRALEVSPSYAKAWNNLGSVLMDSMRVADAKAAYLKSLECAPDYADAHWNLGILYLLEGNLRQGWPEYEQRLRRPEVAHLYSGYDAPYWQGESLAGKTILLHAEQGLGDTLQFIRFVPRVARLAGRTLTVCQPGLKRLLLTLPGVGEVVEKGEALPPYDVRCPLMSLPYRLGIDAIEAIPAQVPYLSAAPEEAARWAARLAGMEGLKVGLVWSGDPRKHDPDANRIDRRRSVPLALFEPLMGMPGVTFVSLQKGEAGIQAEAYAGRLADWMDEIHDFADTAALVSCLDLVIAVDTSVAHLAGALGKPVWLLSRFDGCWRWMLGREDSPWYPALTLFRQTVPSEWGDVLAAVGERLGQVVAGNASRLSPYVPR